MVHDRTAGLQDLWVGLTSDDFTTLTPKMTYLPYWLIASFSGRGGGRDFF
jgi:hypothetical protein